MADVFISYTRLDRSFADALARALERIGLDVWYDRSLSTVSEWRAETAKQLARARLVLALWSPAALKSTWVKAEAELADGRGALLSAVIAPCEVPPPFHLSAPVDLVDWRPADAGGRLWSLAAAIAELLRDSSLRDYAFQELHRGGAEPFKRVESFDFTALMRHCEELRDVVREFDPDVLIAPHAHAGLWAEMLFDWLQRRAPVLVGDVLPNHEGSAPGLVVDDCTLPDSLLYCPRETRLLFVNDRTRTFAREQAFLEAAAAFGFLPDNLACVTLVAQTKNAPVRCHFGYVSNAATLTFFYDVTKREHP